MTFLSIIMEFKKCIVGMTGLCFTMFGDSVGKTQLGRLESPGSFFTHLSGAWVGMCGLRCNCGLECLPEASPGGLGFLTTWKSQRNQTSYAAAQV